MTLTESALSAVRELTINSLWGWWEYGDTKQKDAARRELIRRNKWDLPRDPERKDIPPSAAVSTSVAARPSNSKSAANEAKKERKRTGAAKSTGGSRTARRVGTGMAAIRPGRSR